MVAMPTEVHVYLCPDNGGLPRRISIDDWNAFERGDQPIVPINNRESARSRQIKFLLMTIRDRICELAEPLCVDVDQFGFVQRRALNLRLLEDYGPSIVDGRHRFMLRYLNHAHQWDLGPAVLHMPAANRVSHNFTRPNSRLSGANHHLVQCSRASCKSMMNMLGR